VQAAFNTFGYAAAAVPALLIWHAGCRRFWYLGGNVRLLGSLRRRPLGAVPPANESPQHAGNRARASLVLVEVRLGVGADFLNLRVDVFVVSIMLDARSLGIYSLAVATGELIWQISRPLSWTTTGRVAAGTREYAIALVSRVTRMILAVELLAGIVIFAFAPAAVNAVYGSAYAESGDLVRWLLPASSCMPPMVRSATSSWSKRLGR